jgi:hypothetical protein
MFRALTPLDPAQSPLIRVISGQILGSGAFQTQRGNLIADIADGRR